LKILVLIQYVQDKCYSSSYIADLVVLFLEFMPTPILASDLSLVREMG